MATKAQLERKANAAGCEVSIEGDLVSLYPPTGYRFDEYHIIGREAQRGWLTKSEIYDEMLDAIDDLTRCDPSCTC
jgi:hypothetical protein